jgi:hypothetical protein
LQESREIGRQSLVLRGITTEKATRELGYTLRPLQEGLRETLLYEMHQLGMQPPQLS